MKTLPILTFVLACPISSFAQEVPGVPLRNWNTGDSWAVVSTIRQNAKRKTDASPVTLRWHFAVLGEQNIDGNKCARIKIECVSTKDKRPTSDLWIDSSNGQLRRLRTEIPSPSGYRTITQHYQSTLGSPVVSPFALVPVDLPVFRMAGGNDFRYRAHDGSSQARSIAPIQFYRRVKQSTKAAQASELRQIIPEAGAKSLMKGNLVDVELSSRGQSIRQIWDRKSPWPIYSNNGLAESRLVSFKRGDGR